jgi:hypothetical protein
VITPKNSLKKLKEYGSIELFCKAALQNIEFNEKKSMVNVLSKKRF